MEKLIIFVDYRSNPFCSVPQSSNNMFGCTLGRGAVAQCNRVTYTTELDEDFQVLLIY